MKAFVFGLCIMFAASICQAGCPGGVCRTPVRAAVKATAKGVAKVAKAPFKCRCHKGCCCK